MQVIQIILGLALAIGNIAFWWLVARRGQEWFRRRCERRHGVTIGYAARGFWRVTGPGSSGRRLGIELLQLAYFMGAFLVWAVALALGLGLLALFS